jgi:hypothetical protein
MILKENWNDYIKKYPTTRHQRNEVNKMLSCSKSSCNSRLCSSCGKRYADDWADVLQDILPGKQFSHVVLTVPYFLRTYFRDWKNLSVLMQSSRAFFS